VLNDKGAIVIHILVANVEADGPNLL